MDYKCTICNKQYKSYQSLWNHNKKFHKDINQPSSVSDQQGSANISANDILLSTNTSTNAEQTVNDNKHYYCRKCNKSYNHIQSRWKHEQKCKYIVINTTNITSDTNTELKILQETTKQKELELELKKEEIRLKKEETKILQLKLKLQNAEKVDNVTLKKLNKILLNRQNRIKNSTINSHNTITNIQNNITNYQLDGLGKEQNVNNILTPQEKQSILNSRFRSLEKIIEIVHCGRYNQFKNVIVTNMKDNYMYKYDEKKGLFVLSNKKDVLEMLVNYRLGDLEIIYNEFLENNKIDEKTKSCIEKFINKITYDTEKFKNTDGTTHENYRQYKINEIKVLLFNNQDKIMSDISLLLSTEEEDTEPTNTIIN